MKRINKKKIREVAEKYGLRLVLLFGSQASGKTHFASDFDVAVLGERSINIEKELEICYEFVKIFKTDNVDIVDIGKSGPLLMNQIFTKPHEILFCDDLQIYFRYKIYAMKSYIEAKPLFMLTEKQIDNFLKERRNL